MNADNAITCLWAVCGAQGHCWEGMHATAFNVTSLSAMKNPQENSLQNFYLFTVLLTQNIPIQQSRLHVRSQLAKLKVSAA